jgi:hypothetical protein
VLRARGNVLAHPRGLDPQQLADLRRGALLDEVEHGDVPAPLGKAADHRPAALQRILGHHDIGRIRR